MPSAAAVHQRGGFPSLERPGSFPHAPDFFFEQMGQVRMDRWSSGRAVLLGDAGYCPTPLTGLGTSLALR